MKKLKYLILLFFLTINYSVYSQFAKIIDKDGYVNVREKPSIKGKVISKIKSNEIVFTFSDGEFGNWVIVDYKDSKNKLITGYVHKSRIKYIHSYESIPAITYNKNEITFGLRNIFVEIKSDVFNYTKNKKYFSSTNYGDYTILDKYKGQQIWGTDGTIPKNYYKSIKFSLNNKSIQIPKKEIENLFNVNNEYAKCYYNRKENILYITLMNSDGAGGYVAILEIEKGKYKDKKVLRPF